MSSISDVKAKLDRSPFTQVGQTTVKVITAKVPELPVGILALKANAAVVIVPGVGSLQANRIHPGLSVPATQLT